MVLTYMYIYRFTLHPCRQGKGFVFERPYKQTHFALLAFLCVPRSVDLQPGLFSALKTIGGGGAAVPSLLALWLWFRQRIG